jgi:hypothetical protein
MKIELGDLMMKNIDKNVRKLTDEKLKYLNLN